MTHFVVESNGLVVTKQLMLGNLVGKHWLCFRGSWGLIEGGVCSKIKKNPNLLLLWTHCVCSHFPGWSEWRWKAWITLWAPNSCFPLRSDRTWCLWQQMTPNRHENNNWLAMFQLNKWLLWWYSSSFTAELIMSSITTPFLKWRWTALHTNDCVELYLGLQSIRWLYNYMLD